LFSSSLSSYKTTNSEHASFFISLITASSINSKVWPAIKGTMALTEIPVNQETRVLQAYLVHVACMEKEEFQGCQEYEDQLWVLNSINNPQKSFASYNSQPAPPTNNSVYQRTVFLFASNTTKPKCCTSQMGCSSMQCSAQ